MNDLLRHMKLYSSHTILSVLPAVKYATHLSSGGRRDSHSKDFFTVFTLLTSVLKAKVSIVYRDPRIPCS